MLSFRRILSLRKPVIHRVEYIDIVIENKALLLLTWDFEEKYSLRMPLLRQTYRRKSGAVVVKIPSNVNSLVVVIRGWWRKRVIQIHLKKIQLDGVTAEMLIQQFRPFNMPAIQIARPFVAKRIRQIALPAIAHKPPLIGITNNKISFREENFLYNN